MWGVLGRVQPQFKVFFSKSIKLFTLLIVSLNPLQKIINLKKNIYIFHLYDPYSSTNPEFFTKLNFDFLKFLGAYQNLD
jgi:hypothetical protein